MLPACGMTIHTCPRGVSARERDMGVRGWSPGSLAHLGLILVCALVVATARPTPATACSYAAPPAGLEGYPKNGSVGVPTDVVPVFDYLTARVSRAADLGSSAFRLTSDAGVAVAVTTRQSHVWHIEVVPATPLAPLTRYTLAGHWQTNTTPAQTVDVALSFTTGEGPSRQALPPVASMRHFSLKKASRSSCDSDAHGTCIAHPTESFVEQLYLDQVNDPENRNGIIDTFGPYLVGNHTWGNLSGINQGAPFRCVRLRTRAPNGTFSEPVVLCGADAPTDEFEDSDGLTCGPEGLSLHGKPLAGAAIKLPEEREPTGGLYCSFGAGTGGGGPLGVLSAIGVLALVVRRRTSRP
jgi:hypothetical protein